MGSFEDKKKKDGASSSTNAPVAEDGEKSSETGHLERKIERRDKKIASLTTKIKESEETVEVLEKKLKKKDKATRKIESELGACKFELNEYKNENTKVNAAFLEIKKKLGAATEKLEEGKKPTGWGKYHANHQGKRVPNCDAATMSKRLGDLSNDQDRVEIQKGAFVRFLPGAKCYGYYSEAGTNISIPNNTVVPEMIRTAAVERAKEEVGKHPEQQDEATFVEVATSLLYSFVGDHQTPVYINGWQIECKTEWKNDPKYTSEAILAQQSQLVQQFFDIATQVSGIKGEAENKRKGTVVKALTRMVQNNRKLGLTVHGRNRGRAQRKLTVPSEMWPGNLLVEENQKLPKLPPLADGRELEWPLIGVPISFPPKKGCKGKKQKTEANGNESNTSIGGSSDTNGTVETPQKEIVKKGTQRGMKRKAPPHKNGGQPSHSKVQKMKKAQKPVQVEQQKECENDMQQMTENLKASLQAKFSDKKKLKAFLRNKLKK